MSEFYNLKGHEVVPCQMLEWARGTVENRRVAETFLAPDVRVSTVFLGLEHGFVAGRPLLFETMVFGGPTDGEQDRYSTWEQAEEGHASAVTKAKAAVAAGFTEAK